MVKPLTGVVEELQPGTITLKTVDGQIWRIPSDALHGTVQIGQEISVLFVPVGGEAAAQSAFAKTLINELLGDT